MNTTNIIDEGTQALLDHRMDLDTEAIMKARVAKKTRKGYDGSNTQFMLWLFDSPDEKYRPLLQESLLLDMVEAHKKDLVALTKKGQPSKTRTCTRHVCTAALAAIIEGDKATGPVLLENLTFSVISRYLSTFTKKVKNTDATIRLTTSAYDGARSALAHLFKESGVDQDVNESTKHLWKNFTAYKKGVRRIGVTEKMAIGVSTSEGKLPLPFAAYKFLAQILFESAKPEHIAAHTFLVLEWNLISRADMVVTALIDSIRCHNDAILFEIGRTKTDQEGTRNIDHPWHLYANCEFPQICTFLAMARHLISCPKILEGGCVLFEGSDQYDRFNKIFLGIVMSPKYWATFVSLGMPPQSFGTHSIRKGAVTHIATGSTSCPPIASICLRANWAMPGVMNRYIKFENAGDQFVGQCVSGRSRLTKEFAASPPYFDFSDRTRADKERNIASLDAWIRQRMPVAAQLNDKVFALFKTCLASFFYHRKFLNETLHSKSCLRTSHFMTEVMPYADEVCVKYPWDKTSDTPEITGIPPDVLILAQFESVRGEMEAMKKSMTLSFEQMLKSELDAREIGGSAYAQVHAMMAKTDELMARMDRMMDPCKLQLIPLSSPAETGGEIDWGTDFNLIDEEEVVNDIAIPVDVEGIADQMRQNKSQATMKARGFTLGWHHNKLTPLPADWRYPEGMNLLQLLDLWLVGIPAQNIPPMGKVSTQLIFHFDANGRNYSKMKQVMMFVERHGRMKGVFVKTWDGGTVTTLWDTVWEDFCPFMSTRTVMSIEDDNTGAESAATADAADVLTSLHKSRMGQVSWRTIYNKMEGQGLFKNNKVRTKRRRQRGLG